jgi:hypothetical protein
VLHASAMEVSCTNKQVSAPTYESSKRVVVCVDLFMLFSKSLNKWRMAINFVDFCTYFVTLLLSPLSPPLHLRSVSALM